jgi:hypothetical protein
MSEMQLIETALGKMARRRRWLGVWRGFWRGLLAAALVLLVANAAYKVLPLPTTVLTGAIILGGLLVAAASVWGACGRRTLLDTARWLDQQQKLQERLSTALELASAPQTGEWKPLLIADAAKHAREVDPPRLLPFVLPKVSRWALLVLALCAGLGFVPEYRSQRFRQRQAEAANIRQVGQQLGELTRRSLEQRPPALEPTHKALEQVSDLGERFTKASLTRGEALRDLNSVTDKLRQQLRELGEKPALHSLQQAARESTPGSTGQSGDAMQKQMGALQKALGAAGGDPQKLEQVREQLQKMQQALAGLSDKNEAAAQAAREQLAQSLAEAARQLRDLGQSAADLEEAIRALQNNQTDLAMQNLQAALTDLEKLRQMAKTLQKLQQQAAQLGKNLAEQLKNGQAQAAQQTLQKMIEQLKSANLSQEQLQKILDEVSQGVAPGSQYGQVGEHLKNAAQQLQQGQKTDAAQSLAQAASELEKFMQQLQDADSMLAALDALERAQMAIASGQSWEQCQASSRCKACGGLGCERCKGRGWGHGGRPGAGVGTWAEEEEGWMSWEETGPVDNSGVQRPDMDPRGHTERPAEISDNLQPSKVRGQFSQGAPMPSITLKGVHIKGQSNVKFEEAAAAAQQEAQSALNQDQVPRAYQNAVRDYFDDLKK